MRRQQGIGLVLDQAQESEHLIAREDRAVEIHAADEVMYRAKQKGRNCVVAE